MARIDHIQEGQERARLRGLEMLWQGMKQKEVARKLGVKPGAVSRWARIVRAQQAGGGSFQQAKVAASAKPRTGRRPGREWIHRFDAYLDREQWIGREVCSKDVIRLIESKFERRISYRALSKIFSILGLKIERGRGELAHHLRRCAPF